MYAYCGNDPVNRADAGGHFWHIVIGAGLGAVANGLITIASNLTSKDPSVGWNDGLGTALITGAVTGTFAATGCSPAVNMAVNAIATAVEGLPEVIDDIQKGASISATLGEYALDISISALMSNSGGLGSKHATKLGQQTVKRTWNVLLHDGLNEALHEAGKAASWYWKSAKSLITNIAEKQGKSFLNGLAKTTAFQLAS